MLASDKHSSLFAKRVSDKEKLLYNIDLSGQCNKTFNPLSLVTWQIR